MADLRMPELNNVLIAGNLTKDPVIRQTRSGTPVANFSIASNRKFRDSDMHWQEDVCYVGVVAWNKLAESCSQKLRKGSAVLVEGELQSRTWQSENGLMRSTVEIKARRIQFLNKSYTRDEMGDFGSEVATDDDFSAFDYDGEMYPMSTEATASVGSDDHLDKYLHTDNGSDGL